MNSEDLRLLLSVVFGVISTAALVALGAFFYLATRTEGSQTLLSTMFAGNLNRKQQAFLLLAAGGMMVTMFAGANTLLFWMPSSWGHLDAEGDFQIYRHSISIMFTLIGGGALIRLVDRASHDRYWLHLTQERLRAQEKIYEAATTAQLDGLRAKLQADLERYKAAARGKKEPVHNAILFPETHQISQHVDLLGLIERRRVLLTTPDGDTRENKRDAGDGEVNG